MPNRDADDTQDAPEKYDHSDHPTTHAKDDDLSPPSNAKRDDHVDERAGRRHTPPQPGTPGPGSAASDAVDSAPGVHRVDAGGGGAR